MERTHIHRIAQLVPKLTVGILLAMISFHAWSQRGPYLSFGLEVPGLNYNYKFREQGNLLQKHWVDTNGDNDQDYVFGLAGNIAFDYRFSKNFGIETGLQVTPIGLVVHDDTYFNRHPVKTVHDDGYGVWQGNNAEVDQGNFNVWQDYNSAYLEACYYFAGRYEPFILPFIGAGVAYNSLLNRKNTISADYLQPESAEYLRLTTHFVQHYTSAFIEVGFQFLSRSSARHGRFLTTSAKYYFAGTTMTADYQCSQHENVMYTDNVQASGGYGCFSLRYGFGLGKTQPFPIVRSNRKDVSTYHPPSQHPWLRHHKPREHKRRRRTPPANGKGTKQKSSDSNSRGW